MKRHSTIITLIAIVLFNLTGCGAIVQDSFDIVEESFDKALERTIYKSADKSFEWELVPNAIQHPLSDWKNEIKRVRNITLDDAKAIAASDDRVDYFFFIEPGKTGLIGKGGKETFWPGDAVFFSGEPDYVGTSGRSNIYKKHYLP
ncbi:hypothetical protein CBF23_012370 [Marinomonas agarivorans]|nr:hypothetical protein CBF23_012370 [Marinomonas agarivorans]